MNVSRKSTHLESCKNQCHCGHRYPRSSTLSKYPSNGQSTNATSNPPAVSPLPPEPVDQSRAIYRPSEFPTSRRSSFRSPPDPDAGLSLLLRPPTSQNPSLLSKREEFATFYSLQTVSTPVQFSSSSDDVEGNLQHLQILPMHQSPKADQVIHKSLRLKTRIFQKSLQFFTGLDMANGSFLETKRLNSEIWEKRRRRQENEESNTITSIRAPYSFENTLISNIEGSPGTGRTARNANTQRPFQWPLNQPDEQPVKQVNEFQAQRNLSRGTRACFPRARQGTSAEAMSTTREGQHDTKDRFQTQISTIENTLSLIRNISRGATPDTRGKGFSEKELGSLKLGADTSGTNIEAFTIMGALQASNEVHMIPLNRTLPAATEGIIVAVQASGVVGLSAANLAAFNVDIASTESPKSTEGCLLNPESPLPITEQLATAPAEHLATTGRLSPVIISASPITELLSPPPEMTSSVTEPLSESTVLFPPVTKPPLLDTSLFLKIEPPTILHPRDGGRGSGKRRGRRYRSFTDSDT